MTNLDFGTRLKILREKQGKTQTQLATITGLHRTYISAIEKGKRNITLKNIIKIAQALKVSPAKFFEPVDLKERRKKLKKKEVVFLKLGGTWDMFVTNEGLIGKKSLDDRDLAKLEKKVNYDELKLVDQIEKHLKSVKPLNKEIGTHLFWAPDINKLISGVYIPLLSIDSSHYRPALHAPLINYLLSLLRKRPNAPILCGVGTDTADILSSMFDVFLFDQDISPVLISGANRSYREEKSDAPDNFNNLALVAHANLKPGAYFIFNQTVYSGADVVKIDPRENPRRMVEGLQTFYAPQATDINITFLKVTKNNYQQTNYQASNLPNWRSKEIFTAMNKVVTVDLGDQNSLDHEIKKIRDTQYKAILIKSHGLGNTLNPIRLAIIEAIKNGKLVLNVSRCLLSKVSKRYYVSLGSINNRELKHSKNKIILDGGELNHFSGRSILVRALLEKRSQKQTQELINKYCHSRSLTPSLNYKNNYLETS